MKKNKSVFRVWIISYILILILPILFSTVVYFKYESVLREQIYKENYSVLYNKSKLVDDVIKRAYQFSEANYSNVKIIEFSKYEQPLSDEQKYNMYNFGKKYFEHIDTSTGYIVNEYVYLPKSDYILCENPTDSRTFFQNNYNGTEEEYTWWKTRIGNNSQEGLNSSSEKGEGEEIFRIICIPNPLPYSDGPKTVVEISNDVFLDLPSENHWGFYAIDEENNMIYGKDGLWKEVMETGKSEEFQNLIVNTVKSEETGVTYIFMQNSAEYLSVLKSIRCMIFIILVMCIILGTTIITYSVYYNKKPLNRILNAIGYKSSCEENKFQYISNVIGNLNKEKKEYENILEKQKKYFRGDLIIRFLTEDVEIDKTLLKFFKINFKHELFVIAIICVNPSENMFFADAVSEKDSSLSVYAVENILSEFLPRKVADYLFINNGLIHCIINGGEDMPNLIERVKESIINTNQEVKKNLNFTITAAISDEYSGVKDLSIAYRQVKKILEYRFIKCGEVFLESDVVNCSSRNLKYAYLLQMEERAIKFIKSGDFGQAINTLNQIIKQCKEESCIPLPLIKVLLFNILSAPISVSGEIGDDNLRDIFDIEELYNRVFNCDNIENTQKESEKILEQLDRTIRANATESSFVAKKTKKYIEDNYTNQDISVARLAERFNITANYLSHLFKKEYSVGLLDYLYMLRIKYACKLLAETSMNLEQIASEVGFSNARTLSRSFIKVEGITPGKYRVVHNTQDN